MPTKKPAPPPGLPNISQRVAAMQLASRSHSSPTRKKLSKSAEALVLPEDPSKQRHVSLPTVISFPANNEDDEYGDYDEYEMGERQFQTKNQRPRFMRWKTKDIYTRRARCEEDVQQGIKKAPTNDE